MSPSVFSLRPPPKETPSYVCAAIVFRERSNRRPRGRRPLVAALEAPMAIIFLPHRFVALNIPTGRGRYEAPHAQRRNL